MYANLAERLAANVRIAADTGCYVWTGNVNNRGYARYSIRCCAQQ